MQVFICNCNKRSHLILIKFILNETFKHSFDISLEEIKARIRTSYTNIMYKHIEAGECV